VITNLLSAIPVFGKDLVESNDTFQFIILIKGLLGLYTDTVLETYSFYLAKHAGIILPTVGTVSVHALKNGKVKRLDKIEYLSIPYEFIAFLVGFIDGDGYIRINKTSKGYIAINLVIVLNIEDISTLEYINSVLKFGKITKYSDYKNPICKLIINRTDLQEVIFPLLIHHNILFLTESRRAQFDLAMFIFQNELKFFDKIPVLTDSSYTLTSKRLTIFKLPKTALDYVSLPFFKN
jgi:hypothetical protein